MYNLLQRLIALISLILLSPLFLVVADTYKVRVKRSSIFQARKGWKDNINFTIYKFRSMRTDTPDIATHLLDNPGYIYN